MTVRLARWSATTRGTGAVRDRMHAPSEVESAGETIAAPGVAR
ncbi:hypothetical protein [Micromonospora endophytica]|nr:hypothetical protein [Micromonospora endophytica]